MSQTLSDEVGQMMSSSEAWAFAFCPADADGAPALLIAAGAVRAMAKMRLLRNAQDKNLLEGTVIADDGAATFTVATGDAALLPPGLAVLAATVPELATARVLDADGTPVTAAVGTAPEGEAAPEPSEAPLASPEPPVASEPPEARGPVTDLAPAAAVAPEPPAPEPPAPEPPAPEPPAPEPPAPEPPNVPPPIVSLAAPPPVTPPVAAPPADGRAAPAPPGLPPVAPRPTARALTPAEAFEARCRANAAVRPTLEAWRTARAAIDAAAQEWAARDAEVTATAAAQAARVERLKTVQTPAFADDVFADAAKVAAAAGARRAARERWVAALHGAEAARLAYVGAVRTARAVDPALDDAAGAASATGAEVEPPVVRTGEEGWYPSVGAAESLAELDAARARIQAALKALTDGARAFKMQARSKVVTTALPVTLPNEDLERLANHVEHLRDAARILGDTAAADAVAAHVRLFQELTPSFKAAVAATYDAYSQVLHLQSWRSRLPPEQLVVLDENLAAFPALLTRILDAELILARARG